MRHPKTLGGAGGNRRRGLLGSAVDYLRGKLGGPPPGPLTPQMPADGGKVAPLDGHRGMALGSLGVGKEDVSAENRAKWKRLGGGEAADFVYLGELLFVHSSNVAAAQYDVYSRTMMVEFKGGAAYLYSDVSEDEAIAFANAQSKGSWVWSVCRIRGTKNGHKKPFTKIR